MIVQKKYWKYFSKKDTSNVYYLHTNLVKYKSIVVRDKTEQARANMAARNGLIGTTFNMVVKHWCLLDSYTLCFKLISNVE